ncbi:MAG: hypothetical protein IV085_12580 [Thiobacillus sp.]|nr:hypothetical protein [Thiobacillus sp.]
MKETTPTPDGAAQDVDRIFALLKKGEGRELVNDANVDLLIERAHAAGKTILETELREWKAPCR